MKYAIFAVAALGVPPLAFLLYVNRRWQKFAFWAVLAALVLYESTSINFFSHEYYLGSARGMEVSVIHLLSAALLLSLKLQGRTGKWIPETGAMLYCVYFALCIPSFFTAPDRLLAWFEFWKMILLFMFFRSVYFYLRATDDLSSVLEGFAWYCILNMAFVFKERLAGVYQAHGVFPHQNSMAMSMTMIGSVFFAGYLTKGVKTGFGRLCAVAWACATVSVIRSYSRGGIAMMPVAYGIAALACLGQARFSRIFRRILPVALAGAAGLALLLPKVVERFKEAPEASGNTRVELAMCAWEMVKDRPLAGVGMNNWSINMEHPFRYRDNVSDIVKRDLTYTGVVESVYLLVVAECGVPALLAMLAWFLWHWLACFKLLKRLKGTEWGFVPAGLLGGLFAAYMHSFLEWLLRQQINLFILMFFFATIAYLRGCAPRPAAAEAKGGKAG